MSPLSDRAAQLFRQPLSAPDLLIPQSVNALWKKVQRSEISAAEAEAAALALRASGITFEPAAPLAPEILQLTLRLSNPAYDCTYLALARALGGVLVTADEKLVTRCLKHGVTDLAASVVSLYQLSQ